MSICLLVAGLAARHSLARRWGVWRGQSGNRGVITSLAGLLASMSICLLVAGLAARHSLARRWGVWRGQSGNRGVIESSGGDFGGRCLAQVPISCSTLQPLVSRTESNQVCFYRGCPFASVCFNLRVFICGYRVVFPKRKKLREGEGKKPFVPLKKGSSMIGGKM
jgi:hypothetical protein